MAAPKLLANANRPLLRRRPNKRYFSFLGSGKNLLLYIFLLVIIVSFIGLGSTVYYVQKQAATTTDNDETSNLRQQRPPLDERKEAEKDQAFAQKVLQQKKNQETTPKQISTTTTKNKAIPQSLQDIRNEFQTRYGGKSMSDRMYQRAIKSYGSIEATANRILMAGAMNRPFVMSFGGYSVTVGRGNFLNQSYPFVMQRVLQTAMTEVVPQGLIVRNSAIGGIPSFPYGFCLEHFLGADADVFSWDYSMNEGKGSAVLEAYLRQGLSQLPKEPMLIMLDTNAQRCDLLKQYTNLNIMKDAISVGRAGSVVEERDLSKPESERPPGLQEWDEFGAPKRCPGRSGWHPKKKEHELIGWMIAMHFVSVLERVHAIIDENPTSWKTKYSAMANQDTPPKIFPPNLVPAPANNDPSITELLYGHEQQQQDDDSKKQQLVTKDVSCRTNFLPAVDHEKVLPSLVLDGLNPDASAETIMDDRTDEQYTKGWVLDVSSVERDTKKKVEKCGGLGYIDMKIALYGIPESGPLKLWLPYEGTHHDHDNHNHDDDNLEAKHWFDDLILCEANEKRTDDACQLDRDMHYIVGGVPSGKVQMISGAGEYLKRKTCVNIGVPATAQITHYKNVKSSVSTERQLLQQQHDDDSVGLLLEISAKSPVTRENGACCVSHIVWEQH